MLTIKDCQLLPTYITVKLWSCLRAFTIHHLNISDSSLSFSSYPPELISVKKLSAERVTSQSYEGLLSSLPGLRDIDITIDDAESDISQITAGLRRTGGQQLTNIKLIATVVTPIREEECIERDDERIGPTDQRTNQEPAVAKSVRREGHRRGRLSLPHRVL